MYFALLVAFGLPMVSASCTTGDTSGASARVESEPLTGWQLVLGEEPRLEFTPPTATSSNAARAEQDVRAALASASRAARIAFGVTILTFVLALIAAYEPSSRRLSGNLVVAGIVVVLSFIVLLVAGQGTTFGPDVHHHYGYWAAASLALAGLAFGAWAGMRFLQPRERVTRVGLGILALLVGTPLAATLGFLM
jgi:ABC-type glycerol-3-phosphate transport system permease component